MSDCIFCRIVAGEIPAQIVKRSPEAVAFFAEKGEPYKLEILERLADQTVTFYRNGDFIDLCAGPHVPDVYGSGAGNVFAVGADGLIMRYNGTAWSAGRFDGDRAQWKRRESWRLLRRGAVGDPCAGERM